MKKSIHAVALAAAVAAVPTVVSAQAAPAAKSDWTFAGNAGLYSDYRFRGFAQTGFKPAFQGGFDLGHASGFYLGNWNSNVEQNLYTGASLEMDFYGGYKGAIQGFGYDLGYIYYHYPNSGMNGATKVKNGELYVGGSYGPVSAKWYYATTKFFSLGDGTPYDTKGSWYLDLSGAFDVGNGVGLVAHYGYQKIEHAVDLGLPKDNVSDYKVGVTYDVLGSGWIAGAAVIGTSEKGYFKTAEGKDAGKTGLVLSIAKTF